MFETLFDNMRAGPVILYLPDGTVLRRVRPGERASVGVADPKISLYARWSKVTFMPFRDNAWVEFVKRPGFAEPDLGSEWVTNFLNSQGDDLEPLFFGGNVWYFPNGIFVRVPIFDIRDPWALAESVELRRELKREKTGGSDYFSQKELKRWVVVRKRNDNDLKRIMELRKPK